MAESQVSIDRAYKTLRNHLRKVETIESLYVIWAYLRNINRGEIFPSDITPVEGFSRADNIQKIRWVAPWDLEILAREVIIHSQLNLTSPKSFKDPNYFANAVNKQKEIDGAIALQYINVGNVMNELERRLTYRQFDWQINPANHANLTRYFKIFGDTEVNYFIENETGLSTSKIFTIGLVLWNLFTEKFAIESVKFDIPEIQQTDVSRFEELFSEDVGSLRPVLKEEVQINEKFNYAFNSLKRFPLLRNTKNGARIFFCPFPDLMFKRITSGLYYFVKWTGTAGNALGNAFQKYVGDVLNAMKFEDAYEIIPETFYNKERKNTVDWILSNEEEALFIECKTKRPTYLSKEELLTDDSTEKDLGDIAEAVFQIYKTINDYRNNQYMSLRFSPQRSIYPLLVTMEEWFLMGNRLDSIKTKVQQKLEESALHKQWLEDMPFSICSIQEFELLMRVIKSKNIKVVIEGKHKDQEMKKWTFASYLSNQYKEILTQEHILFPDVFKEILPISIGQHPSI